MPEWLYPLHPKLVHFPVALFISAFILQLLSFILKKPFLHHCSLIVYLGATLMTPLIVLTGLWEEDRIHLDHPVLESHEELGLLLMYLTLGSLPLLWFLKKKRQQWFSAAFTIILLVVSVLVTLTAHYGGKMVFEYGVGTKLF